MVLALVVSSGLRPGWQLVELTAVVYLTDRYASVQVCRVLEDSGIAVTATAAEGRSGIASIDYAHVDVAVVEASLAVQPNQVLMRTWSANSVALVAIVRPLDHLDPIEVLDMGARGLVAAGGPPEELLQAVQAATTGALYVSGRMSELVAGSSVSRRRAVIRYRSAVLRLTPRERDVFTHVVAGRTDAEIARQLSISVRTVRFHVSSILAKLGHSSRVDLIRFTLGAHVDT